MDLGLKNKKALVLGGSGGIGKEIARSMINESCTVCIASRSEENLKKAQEEINAHHIVAEDLSKEGAGKRVSEKALELMGGVDVLIYNTGGPQKGAFSEISSEQWKLDYQSLFLTLIESMNVVLPKMKDSNWGRIQIVTSIAAREPLPNLTTSNALRAGINGLVKSVSTEYAPYGITINTIQPGYTNTDRLKALNLTEEWIKNTVPAGRLGEPEEIGDLSAFLASDKAGYINGQNFAVDGGVLKGHY